MHYEYVLSQGSIGELKLKNRIVMPLMQTNYADVKGFITGRQIDYYTERAKGGVGLIIFEHTGVPGAPGHGQETERQLWRRP